MKLRVIHESANNAQASGLLIDLWIGKNITAALALADIAEELDLNRTSDVLRYFFELDTAEHRYRELNERRLDTDREDQMFDEITAQTKAAYAAYRELYDGERGDAGYQLEAVQELQHRHCYEPRLNKARNPGAVIATSQTGRCYRLTNNGYRSQAVTIPIWPRISYFEPMNFSGRTKHESSVPVLACLLMAIRVSFIARNSKWR